MYKLAIILISRGKQKTNLCNGSIEIPKSALLPLRKRVSEKTNSIASAENI